MSAGASGRKPWDNQMKQLFVVAPQDYVTWLLEGAIFRRIVSPELHGETLHADMLMEIEFYGKTSLLHVEFQRRHDPEMAERLWSYNHEATRQYKCPVWSVVIYLKKEKVSTESPYSVIFGNGVHIHDFRFNVVKLWEIPTEALKQKGLPGLLPLLPLTQNGMRQDVVEDAIAEAMSTEQTSQADLLALIYGLASLAFEKQEDQDWLIGRFNMLYEILRETPVYQEMTRRNIEEGKLQDAREFFLFIVGGRFSTLTSLASELAALVYDIPLLRELALKISMMQDVHEAELLLLQEFKKHNK